MSTHPTGGRPKGDAWHLLIVEARFYPDISDLLLAGAKAALQEAGATFDRIQVPGALELPTAIAIASESELYDGYVALGCVIRGETSHYDIVAGESARGLVELGLDGVPIGNGILTCDTGEQARVRADPARRNKGGGAARAVLALLEVARCLRPAYD